MGQFHKAGGGIDHLERLGRGDSPVHALHPAAKGVVTLGYIVAVVSVPPGSPDNLSRLVPFLLYPVLVASVSGTPWKPLFARLVPVLPFVLFFGLSNLVLMREPVLMLAPALPVTRGMVFCAVILLKTMFTVFAVLLLIATTPFNEIAECLTAPPAFRVLGLQILLTMRYIATLLDEAEAMWTAYALRAPGVKAVRMKDMGTFMGQLLLRSFDRAERVFCAMKCRGFTGVYRGCASRRFVRRADGAFTVVNIAYIAACLAFFAVLRLVNVSVILGKPFL